MVHLTDPGLVLAPSPAEKLIRIIPAPFVLDPERDPTSFRRIVAAQIRGYNGFGCGKIEHGDKPPKGRPEAYGYLLFPFEGTRHTAGSTQMVVTTIGLPVE